MRCPRCDRQLVPDDRFCSRCGLARCTDGKPVDPLLGITVANRYRIDERIGVGGMGTVYRGTHIRLGQSVAIKVLHERYADDQKLTRRFEKEALTYGQVTHPNLVGLHDFGRTEDGTFFMVLEYCPGVSLSKLIREQGRLDPLLAGDIILQIAQGLGAAHKKGIVHRDLKPENIILMETRPGRYHARLLDFGIAKRIDDDEPRLTQAGMVFGTPEYMAPEQARGKTVDARSDIYALGTMLYELLTGDPPFTGTDKLRIMQQQANEVPKSPTVFMPGIHVPSELERLVMRCIEKDPAKRYQTTLDLIEGLDTIVHSSRLTPEPLPVTRSSATIESDDIMRGDDPTTRLESLVLRASGMEQSADTSGTNYVSDRLRNEPPSIGAVALVVGLFCLLVALPVYHWLSGPSDETAVGMNLPEPEPDQPVLPVAKGTQSPASELASTKAPSKTSPLPNQRATTSEKPKKPLALVEAERDRAAAKAAAEAKAKAEKKRLARLKAKRLARERAALAQARKRLSQGDFASAARECRSILKQSPVHAVAKNLSDKAKLGLKLSKQTQSDVDEGRCQKALSRLSQLKKLAPKAPRIDKQIAFCRNGMPPRTEL